MVRKMMKFKKEDIETVDVFMERSTRQIRSTLRHHNVVGWDMMSHRAVFRWASKLVSIADEDPNRITSIIFGHKDWEWIQSIADQNAGRQLHERILKTWRWERPLYKFFGTHWKYTAMRDPVWWQAQADNFLEWRAFNR